MNYAEDRLDRRARHVDCSSKDGLWADYQEALLQISSSRRRKEHHQLLGRTLRDAGWTRHATFHFGMAYYWRHHDDDDEAVGDYAQMTELAGFPELGVLALLFHRFGRDGVVANDEQESPPSVALTHDSNKGPEWLRQNPPPAGNCGCGHYDCGKRLSFLSASCEMNSIVHALSHYTKHCASRMNDMPSSGSILASLAKSQPLSLSTDHVPEVLQFWKTDASSSEFRGLVPVVQLLLVKLLYSTLPSLAAEAVVHLQFDNPRALANEYKSHWAYYVLIRAVVLGERIKPHRRMMLGSDYHVPVWDLLWQKDCRLDRIVDKDSRMVPSKPIQWSTVVEQSLDSRAAVPKVHWSVPSSRQYKPLFVVGDSHVISLAWTTVFVPRAASSVWEPRLMVPLVVTGLKAWHTRRNTNFFTHSLLHTSLQRLPPGTRTILMSAGEIDCREGIGGPLLEGYCYSVDVRDHVKRTVQEYIDAVSSLAEQFSLQILLMPVVPHAHRSEKNGKAMGRAFRRHIIQAWNDELRAALPYKNVFLLDYERRLRHPEPASSVGYVLNPKYNADGTHVSNAILPQLEHVITQSFCNTDIL